MSFLILMRLRLRLRQATGDRRQMPHRSIVTDRPHVARPRPRPETLARVLQVSGGVCVTPRWKTRAKWYSRLVFFFFSIDVVRSDADADADADVTLWRCVRQTKREKRVFINPLRQTGQDQRPATRTNDTNPKRHRVSLV